MEEDFIVDTTVQEKNITHPTDVKLYSRVTEYCWRIAAAEGIELRQRYTRGRKKYLYLQRFRKSKIRFKQAIRAERTLKVIAGRLIRELLKKIPNSRFRPYVPDFDTFIQIVHQKNRTQTRSIVSMNPMCNASRKARNTRSTNSDAKCRWRVTKNSGVCVGAMSFEKNPYDGHTLPAALEQCERLTGQRPKAALVDLGYRGSQKAGDTDILYAHLKRGFGQQAV